MSEEVETFWRRCREQRSLPPNPNRFAVQTVKALLRQLLDEDVLMAIGRKCGWDMLLKADSHHYAVGLLARELCHVSRSFCRSIAVSLLPRLSRGEPLWELPALAFLVEVLHCLNPRQYGPSVLQIISRHLRSQCPERRRLALRGLVVLSKAPSMVSRGQGLKLGRQRAAAKSIWSLNESLLELLQDADTDAVQMTLSAFINVLGLKIIKISTPTALKLLEVLRPLFDNEHSQLQQLSMLLFRELMEATERNKSLKPHVYLSLVPFYFNWHNENQRVAEASRRALFGAARFLKWRDLEHLVTMEQPWRFPECLLEKDRSRVGQYVRQALPFLESPEEPLRKLAIKFLALQDMTDDSPAVSNLAQETLHIIRAIFRAVLRIPSQQGRHKAFSTCLPHLAVLSLFVSTVLLSHLKPPSISSPSLDLALSVLYSVVPPALNPLIYSLRNQEVKDAIRKMMTGCFSGAIMCQVSDV
ncbi:maestro heat-like repeat-containing protein family member 7 [Pseudopipra pipra]|uniref:maestro heat-like repeat-containing protein family member 7 n=1 Tax=Pseudopipra pipra TaxID=415032 RepID=UPI0031399887